MIANALASIEMLSINLNWQTIFHREAVRKSLEEKKKGLEESLYATNPETQEKLQKLREVELELQSTLSEIKKRYNSGLEFNNLYRYQMFFTSPCFLCSVKRWLLLFLFLSSFYLCASLPKDHFSLL